MSKTTSASDEDMQELLGHAGNGPEPRGGFTPLAAAGIGVATFITGAALAALWPGQAKTAPVAPETSVYSCAEQYTQIAAGLNALVSEGIEAGQAGTPDVSWINSVNERQEVFASQVEALSGECVDGAAPSF